MTDITKRDPTLMERYRRLQFDFIAQRGLLKTQNTDIAGILKCDAGTISEAESPNFTYIWPRYFLSHDVASAYCNGDKTLIHALEKKAFLTFYPDGINTLKDLVLYAAYRNGQSVESLGEHLSIKHINQKTNPKQNSQLSISEKIKLRCYLSRTLDEVAALNVNIIDLDFMLPDPLALADTPGGNFRDMLNMWAKLCSGSNAASFVETIKQHSGTIYNPSSVNSWSQGIGLAAAMPDIITTLESSLNTKQWFTSERKALFKAVARTVIPESKLSSKVHSGMVHEHDRGSRVFEDIQRDCSR